MLPEALVAATHKIGDIVGLQLGEAAGAGAKIYSLEVTRVEGPNDLADYSIGTATAMSSDGTGWNAIQNTASANWLEPEDERTLYQIWYGITPSYARIYRQYPGGTDRGSLRGTRAVGSANGFIDGTDTPYRYPSPRTMFHTVKGLNPNFNGYHPYAIPATTPNIYLWFYVMKYQVRNITGEMTAEKETRQQVFTVGGIQPLVTAPTWLSGGNS